MLEPGPYKLTVLDTSQMTCDEANDAVRAVLREPGAALPDGWKVDAPSSTITRADGTDGIRIEADTACHGGRRRQLDVGRHAELDAHLAADHLHGR